MTDAGVTSVGFDDPLDTSASAPPPARTRSVSKRFTVAFIGVITLLLVAFAVVVIVGNVRKIDADLRDLLDDAARLAQVTLPIPLWNLDTETLASFAEALLLREPLAFVEILSESQTAAARARSGEKYPLFSSFAGSSGYIVKTADIVYQGKKIGSIRLAVSRGGLWQAIAWNAAGILALTVLIIAAISWTSIVITRRYIARPLQALQRSAGLIASGNLEASIDTSQQDEIGHLARDLDGMRGSLQRLIEERRRNEERLEEANRTLEQRVEERTSALQANTRELTRTVDELRALGEVGRAVSSTLDLETVLTVIVSHAAQITGTDGGAIYEFDAETGTFHLRATHQMDPELIEALREHPPRLGEGTVGRAAASRMPVQIADIDEDPTYGARLRHLFSRHGYRARLAVPLIREDQIVGALVVRRKTPGPFSPELTELLQTFATQSIVAIQNARFFRESEAKSRELERLSQDMEQLYRLSTAMQEPLSLKEQLGRVLETATRLGIARPNLPLGAEPGWGAPGEPGGRGLRYRRGEGLRELRDPARGGGRDVPGLPGWPSAALRRRPPAAPRALSARSLPHQGPADEPVPGHSDDRARGDGGHLRRRQQAERSPDRARDGAAPPDVRLPRGGGHRQCPPVRDPRGEEPGARAGGPPQVPVPRQHEPRAPDPDERHHRRRRALAGGCARASGARTRSSRSSASCARRGTCSRSSTTSSTSPRSRPGRWSCTSSRFSVAVLVEDVASTVRPMAEKNGNRLRVECDAEVGMMRADPTRVRQALLNLASNAAKFTEQGLVTIAAARDAGDRRASRVGYRDRHDARADRPALPGLHASRCLHHAQVRRDRPRARHQPAVLPHDGRRHHRGERAGAGIDLHHPAARSRWTPERPTWPGGRARR